MEIHKIEQELIKAEADPKNFFGSDPDSILRDWHSKSHPDRFPDQRSLAESYFLRFTQARESLNVKIVKVKLRKREVELVGKPVVGDTSDVYFGDEIIKIGRLNDLSVEFAKREFEFLNGVTDEHFRKYLPIPIHNEKQVSIFGKRGDFTNLSSLSGIEGRHVAWIYKRLLEIIGFSHSNSISHGGIVPANIIIFKQTHGINLLDWKFAGKEKIKKSKAYLPFYPEDENITKETDIYMATKTVMSIAGPLPSPMLSFFKGCLQQRASMRPNDAWSLCDEFSELLEKLYGKPQFVEMK